MSKELDHKISLYKRKFYVNLLLKGLLIAATILLSVFLFFALVEYQANFNTTVRTIFFYGYIVLAAFVFYKLILFNVISLLYKGRRISDYEAAKNIGNFFPEVQDKLLNLFQLKSLQSSDNQLIAASIDQKTHDVIHLPFTDSVDFKKNNRYLRILLIPFLIVTLLSFISPQVLTEPAKRFILHKTEFIPAAPFQFHILNENLQAFKNENFDLLVELSGESIPSEVFLVYGERTVKLSPSDNKVFTFTFEKIQNDIEISLNAAGFYSNSYKIKVVNRPNIKNFEVELQYPTYLGIKQERLQNIGNIQIPEGTNVKWYFETLNANNLSFTFDEGVPLNLQKSGIQLFTIEKQLFESSKYSIQLENEFGSNRDMIQYSIDVLKDQYPKIDLQQHQDTLLFNLIVLGGRISDDYGLSNLSLFYKVTSDQKNTDDKFNRYPIAIDRTKKQQSFYLQWLLDSLKLSSGKKIEYYLSVSDNDGINGSKTTQTGLYKFEVPSKKEVKENIEKISQSTENQIDKSIEDAINLKKELDKAEDRLKGKKELNWQEEKLLEDIIEQKLELENEIKKLQQKFDDFSEMKKRFDENAKKNKQIADKMEQLQQLMDELLDEETKKLYEQLQELLKEKSNFNEIKDIVEKLNQKEFNLENELERSLELFKRLKYEQKLEENIQESDILSEEQEKLSEDTSEKNKSNEELAEQQQKLQEKLDELKKNIEEQNKLNQELKNPNSPADLNKELDSAKQSMQNSQENLQQNKNKKAGKNQQNAQQQLQKMSEKLAQMQSSMGMMSMQANLGDLREILENLIKISFEQESIMDQFRTVDQTDPKFIELSQKQLNIKDDAKIIEDSLISLSERVFQIQSFVTREVGDMNKNIDDAVDAIKERKKDIAVGKQQYAMTSMNNLALMLDDVMTQMQQAMADMMGTSKNKENMPGQAPSMSELQQQLNQQIQQLQQSGKQGRQLSEELARMAAEQEKIRQMLEKMQKELGNNPLENGELPGSNLSDVLKKMEETEMDLVNKKITEQTILRQEEIVTRLLEAEKSERERELSEEREGERAKNYERKVPLEFEEYIKMKEQEVELLKTVPPKLNPYYKEEVNKYFNRLGGF